MTTNLRSLLIGLLWSIAVGSFIISCAASNTTNSSISFVTPTPTPTATPVTVATPTPVGATPVPGSYTFSISATFPTYVPYTLHGTSSWTDSCSVTVTGGTPAVAKDCLLEIEEGDLIANEWTMNWSAGVGGCPYVIVTPYWFMQYAGGQGATKLAYTVSADGSIDPNSLNQVSPGGGTLFAIVDNQIKCIYDHSAKFPAGPNACYGSYTEVKTTLSTSGTTVTTGNFQWGGKIGNAAAGPAADTGWVRGGANELPGSKIYPTYAGSSGSIAIAKHIADHNTNMYSENYIANPASLPAMLTPYGNPYYTFSCVDGALDVLARLRVQVRGWNLASELAKGSLGTASTAGTQNGSVVSDPNNDRHSIDDLKADAVTYPDGYPEDDL